MLGPMIVTREVGENLDGLNHVNETEDSTTSGMKRHKYSHLIDGVFNMKFHIRPNVP